MKLSEAKKNDHVIIKCIDAGRSLQGRLLAMGLIPNKKIRIINSASNSPVIIKVKDSTITLGYGMASKIIVEKI